MVRVEGKSKGGGYGVAVLLRFYSATWDSGKNLPGACPFTGPEGYAVRVEDLSKTEFGMGSLSFEKCCWAGHQGQKILTAEGAQKCREGRGENQSFFPTGGQKQCWNLRLFHREHS